MFTSTNALGEGIDAPGIRVVIHVGIVDNLDDYGLVKLNREIATHFRFRPPFFSARVTDPTTRFDAHFNTTACRTRTRSGSVTNEGKGKSSHVELLGSQHLHTNLAYYGKCGGVIVFLTSGLR